MLDEVSLCVKLYREQELSERLKRLAPSFQKVIGRTVRAQTIINFSRSCLLATSLSYQ